MLASGILTRPGRQLAGDLSYVFEKLPALFQSRNGLLALGTGLLVIQFLLACRAAAAISSPNGLGQLLITGIQGADLPLVQTLTFIFAILIVLFNLIADVLYGILDPRIRYA